MDTLIGIYVGLWNDFGVVLLPRIYDILVFLFPIYIPLLLLQILWPMWVSFIRARYILSQKYSLLEIKMPQETFRSPVAMEMALGIFHQPFGDGGLWDKYWHGKTLPWFSLEITSFEGQVKFFVWTRKEFVRHIENSFYSQFPDLEIKEVDDYTKHLSYKKGINDLWACELRLIKDDAYPIKTYVDYGLDRDPKEEFKIDPITPLIEFLGSVGVNQQVFIQILVKAHRKEMIKKGMFLKKVDPLVESAKKIIAEIRSRDPETRFREVDEDSKLGIDLSSGEEEVTEAIENALRKPQYDVVIRATYISKKENFDGGNIGGILGAWKQFGSEHLNGFMPNLGHLMMSFAMPWNDFLGIRKEGMKKNCLNILKLRSGFFTHLSIFRKPFILNSEELATIFHFPGKVSQTPTFARLLSKKAEPPANLPI